MKCQRLNWGQKHTRQAPCHLTQHQGKHVWGCASVPQLESSPLFMGGGSAEQQWSLRSQHTHFPTLQKYHHNTCTPWASSANTLSSRNLLPFLFILFRGWGTPGAAQGTICTTRNQTSISSLQKPVLPPSPLIFFYQTSNWEKWLSYSSFVDFTPSLCWLDLNLQVSHRNLYKTPQFKSCNAWPLWLDKTNNCRKKKGNPWAITDKVLL